MFLAALLIILSMHAWPVYAALFNSTSDLPPGKTYDYIVIGAGTAGCVVGTRLSEDPSKNVLIIEAGGNPDDDIDTQVPSFNANNFGSAVDWNFTTVAQPNLNGRVMKYSIGKTLGGTSSTNFLLYNRGGKDDYDRWANMTGDPGWSWQSLFPYYTNRIEHPALGEDFSQQWVANDHGRTGPLALSIPSFTLASDAYVLNATQELSDEFPYNPDLSSGNSLGLGWATATAENGTRASAWTHYLRPVVNRDNLDVLINTQVTRVLQTGTQDGQPVFQGVEFAANATAPRGTLNVTREIILSAGAVLTPQILMLSGIGDNTTLSSLGIETVVNNSNVGQNVQDRPRLGAVYSVEPKTPTLDIYKQNATLNQEALATWKANQTGPFTVASGKQMAFGRNPTDVAPFNMSDPSAGPTCGHYQLVFVDQYSSFVQPAPSNGSYFTIITNVVASESYGNVTLNSSSPFAAPLINPAIFDSYYDLATMREGIKAGYRFVQSKTLSTDFVVSPYGYLATALNGSDAAIERLAKSDTTVTWHMTGSARMVSQNGTDGVLDSRLNVLGTVGLRVVDASAIPRTPAANTMAPVFILAERAADIIKADAGPLPPY